MDIKEINNIGFKKVCEDAIKNHEDVAINTVLKEPIMVFYCKCGSNDKDGINIEITSKELKNLKDVSEILSEERKSEENYPETNPEAGKMLFRKSFISIKDQLLQHLIGKCLV